MLARPRIAAALAVLAMACATPGRRGTAQDHALQVHSLRIHGARQVSAGDIEKHLVTTANSWVPFSRKQYFDPDVWRTDLRRIEKFYEAQGFYQAKVVRGEVKPHGTDAVDLSATVVEGDPTRIRSIDVEGIEDLPAEDRARLREQIELRVGQRFVAAGWQGLKAKLLQALRQEGYAAATVQGEAKVGLDTRAADVAIRVDHGPRYRFGATSVEVTGARPIPRWIITEQVEAEARPGDRYSLKAQGDAETRVYRMGVFGAVKVRPGTPDPTTRTVPLQVDAQESQFHTLSAGGGIAVDQTRQEARITASYVDRDFLGGLRRLTLGAMAGYAWIPTFYASAASGAQQGVVGNVSAELEQPRFLFRDLRLDAKLTLERGLEPAYAYYGATARLGVIYTPTTHLTITPSYNLQYYRLQSGVAQLGGTAPTLLFGCPQDCVLSYAEELVEWDERDDRQEPHHGYYLATSLQEGGGVLGGSFGYFRIVPDARGYASFLDEDRLTFAGRIKLGTLVPFRGPDTSSPIVSRFYSGGNDMRGFNTRRLSPQLIVPRPGSTTAGYAVPIGGDGLFEASLEARYALAGPLLVAAFVDTGFVTAQHLDLTSSRYFLDNLFVAVGTGVRYRTPLGPIRLDFGYRLDVGPPLLVTQTAGLSAPTRSSCFGLGKGARAGAPEGPCVIHISIGEAF